MSMTRGSLLKRALGAVAGLYGLKHLPIAEPEIADGWIYPALQNGWHTPRSLVASGGLCAPMEPFYNLPSVWYKHRPVADGMMSFTV